MHVPEGWAVGHVKDLLSGLNSGVSVNSEDRPANNSEIGVLKVSSVSYGAFLPNENKRVIQSEVNLVKESPRKGCIVISRSNTEALVGASVFIDKDYSNLFLPDKLWQTIPRRGIVTDQKWLFYFLSSEPIRYRLSKLATGTSGSMKNITKDELLTLPIKIPPFLEQTKIAQILSTWDKAIEKLETLIVAKQKQKKALMQQLLTGKKRFVEFGHIPRTARKGYTKSKLGELPNDWKVDRIKKYFWYQEGPGVRQHQFTEKGVKLFNGTNIQFNKIELSNTTTHISAEEANGAYKHFLAENGDLVIACSGISVDRFDEKIGFINDSHLPLCMNTSTMRFKTLDQEQADIDYFKYFMMSPLFKNQIRRQITGSAQLNFGPSHVGKCYVVLPTIEEQQKIASVLSVADKEIENYQKHLAALKQQKKALMQQLLTGKKRVKVEG